MAKIQFLAIVTKTDTIHAFWFLFMDLDAQEDGFFHVNTLFLPFYPFKGVMKGKTFAFTKECMKNFVSRSLFNILFSHMELHPSAELIKVAYETALRCNALMRRLQAIFNQSIGSRPKNPTTVTSTSLAIAK